MIQLKDKLSHLNFRQACKLLRLEGDKFIREGGKYDFDLSQSVSWGDNIFSLDLGEVVATVSLDPAKNQRLNFQCSACTSDCKHLGPFFLLS